MPLNEKEFFYRARMLRRARKQIASAGWTGRFQAMGASEEVAALATRCQYLEWTTAVAHSNVAQLHERLRQLEEMPPLPLPATSPEA